MRRPIDCALREAHEEIGLEASRIEPLGYLDSYRTGTGFQINPVVALVTPGFDAVLDPREVVEVFEVPLAFLMDPANHQKALARVARPRALLLCHALRGALYLGRDCRHAQEHAPEAVSAMIRVVIENILLFLLPTAIYLGYVLLTRRSANTPGDGHQRGAAGLAVRARRAVRGRHARLLRHHHAGRHAGSGLYPAAHEERADRARSAQVAAPMTASTTPGPLPRLAGADWLTRRETQAVFAALAAKGFAARAVGGAVRNALLGRPVVDVDIATTARPEEVIAAAEAAGPRRPCRPASRMARSPSSPTRVPYEVTTLRRDVETHGRHATVAFTDDWAADARRRDFTINALYCSADGEVFDPLGGDADIEARRVRFIGDARERIREDYLRILRFFRLTAEYGEGAPDAEGLAACVRERDGLRAPVGRARAPGAAAPAGCAARAGAGALHAGLRAAAAGAGPAAPRPMLLQRLADLEAALGAHAGCHSAARRAGGGGARGRRPAGRPPAALQRRARAALRVWLRRARPTSGPRRRKQRPGPTCTPRAPPPIATAC